MCGFPKGHIPWIKGRHPTPWNKGITGYMGANKTSFKKGQTPWNKQFNSRKEYDKWYRDTHKEERRIYQKQYYQDNKEREARRAREYYINNPATRIKHLTRTKTRLHNRWVSLVILLGGKCVCDGIIWKCWHQNYCNVDYVPALNNDHKHDDGKEDRKRFKSSTSFIKYYLEHPEEAKEKLQVLCVMCNWIKRLENNRNGNG